MLYLCSFKMRAVPHYIPCPLPSGASSPFLPRAAGWPSYSPLRAQFKHQLLLEDFLGRLPCLLLPSQIRDVACVPSLHCGVPVTCASHHWAACCVQQWCVWHLCSALAKCLVHSRCLKRDQKQMKKMCNPSNRGKSEMSALHCYFRRIKIAHLFAIVLAVIKHISQSINQSLNCQSSPSWVI